ncbi:MAG: YfcE family phosphodiesterase [Candidatus Aminicenantes bacterium]|nr:YfcE family phosphodiesterase [Candidatus Aminicenantes bacterium]
MIGIMSDSHDNCDAVKKAVRFFNDVKCELIIHAGDFVAPFAAKELERLECPVKAVFGNCDGEKQGLKRVFESLGSIQEEPRVFNWKDTEFLVTHTHFKLKEQRKIGDYDVIIYGHTHKPDIHQSKEALIINPGETGGWLTGKTTVALLSLKDLGAEIINL